MAEKIRHLVFNEKLSVGIDFIEVDHNYAQSKKNLAAPHRASFYSIIWFKAGDVVHQVDFSPINIQANTFLFVRKDAIQFFDHEHSFNSQVLIFTETFFCINETDHQFLKSSVLFNDFKNECTAVSIKVTPALQSLWSMMTAEFAHSTDPYRTRLLKNYLYSFLLTAERERNHDGFQQLVPNIQLTQLILFKEELEQHFRDQKSIAFYAEKLAITSKVLTNATLKTVGKTPKQMTDERVILEAKRMLVYSNDSGKMIGFNLGFAEPTNFVKFFKKQTGLTPSAFRIKYSS